MAADSETRLREWQRRQHSFAISAPRQKAFLARWRLGETMTAIGDSENLTQARVNQIIRKARARERIVTDAVYSTPYAVWAETELNRDRWIDG